MACSGPGGGIDRGYRRARPSSDLEAQAKAELPDLLGRLSPDAREGIQDFLGVFASSMGLFTAILNLALLPIFTFYLLNEWDRIVAFFGSLIPLRHRARTTTGGTRRGRAPRGIRSRGQLTVAACSPCSTASDCGLAGIDLAVHRGRAGGCTFVVPYLGTVVGVGLGSVLCS